MFQSTDINSPLVPYMFYRFFSLRIVGAGHSATHNVLSPTLGLSWGEIDSSQPAARVCRPLLFQIYCICLRPQLHRYCRAKTCITSCTNDSCVNEAYFSLCAAVTQLSTYVGKHIPNVDRYDKLPPILSAILSTASLLM